MLDPTFPRPQSSLVDGEFKPPSREWYEFWRRFFEAWQDSGIDTALIQSILSRLTELEQNENNFIIQGLLSVTVSGTPQSGMVQITLDNDVELPGNTYYYGTGPAGIKGYFQVADAFTNGPGIDLTTGPDGVTDIAFDADTALIATLPGATYTTLQEFLNVMHSPGLVSGSGFTDLGGGTLRVLTGTVAIRDVDDDVSRLYLADFPQADLAIPNDSVTRFIGVERNGTAPQVIMKSTDTWDMDTEFPLGTVANLGGTLFPFFNPFKVGDPITNIIQRFDAQATIIRSAAGGLILANVATRTATLSAGTAWARLNDYPITAKNSGTQTLISIRPNPAAPPPLIFTPGFTQWPNTQYLSGTTLTTMTNNRWANLWFFVNIATNAWGFAYGTAEYNNASLAAQEGVPSYLTANFLANNLLVGRMLFEKNNDTPIVESAFTRAFSTLAVSDHNQLSNLQGGTTNEYYHLTAAQYAALGNPLQFATAMHIASMRP